MSVNSATKKSSARTLAQLGLLTAVIIILTYLPLRFFAIEMTLRMIPVVLGAILLGPLYGAVLGGIFGLTSLFECLGILGMPLSAFGSFIIGLNPLCAIIICFVPRIIMGFLAGWIFRWVSRIDRTRLVSYIAANISGALLNTVLFTSGVLIFFWNDPAFIAKMAEWGLTTSSVWVFVAAFVGLNGLVEALVCAVAGTAISRSVHLALKSSR